jgi:gamma-glutamylcysteine synthetase
MKISIDEFFFILKANGGLYQRTAKAIAQKYNCTYTRQTVKIRAEKYPERLQDLRDSIVDTLEEENLTLARKELDDIIKNPSTTTKERIMAIRERARITQFHLEAMGKHRGYGSKIEMVQQTTVQATQEVNLGELNHEELEVLAKIAQRLTGENKTRESTAEAF